jgi:tripartite-type tricarboxylate transporter receptor subunit TctC
VSETVLIFMAPTGTPSAVIERLTEESTTILRRSEVRERARSAGFAVLGAGPAALSARIAREVPAFKDLIERAGIARI